MIATRTRSTLPGLMGLALLVVSCRAVGQDELPKRSAGDALEFEPNLKLYDVKPERGGPTVDWETVPTAADEEKTRIYADQAKRKAERWQQLQRRGVVSKMEAERATLQANRASLRYQQAHVLALRAQVEGLKQRVAKGEGSADMLASSASALATAERIAAETEALARKTDLEFAQNNVERQQQLLRYGLGSKAQLGRAQAELTRLQAPATPAPVQAPAPAR